MKKSAVFLLVPALCAILAGCSPVMSNRGNLVKNYQLTTLAPGVSTKNDVLHALGSPTTQGAFDDNTWFYIGRVKEKTGIFDPKVVNGRILKLSFNKDGVLQDIKDVGGKGEEIPYVRDKTPTSGNTVTVMQQLLGNLGRFNGQTNQKSALPGGDPSH